MKWIELEGDPTPKPWRRTMLLLLAALLALGALALPACGDGGGYDEAVEEVRDEAEDAKDEVEDEVDDRS